MIRSIPFEIIRKYGFLIVIIIIFLIEIHSMQS